MRFKQLDLNLLVALEVLLTERSVSIAAKRLCRTQPALSGSLSRLRDHFQDDLLVSSGRSMVLTPFAETLIDPLRRLMVQIEQTVDREAQFDAQTSDRIFTLAAGDAALDTVLAGTIARVGKMAPGVVLDIQSIPNDTCVPERRNLDLIIGSDLQASDHYDAEILFEEPYVAIGKRAESKLGAAQASQSLTERGRVALSGPGRDSSPLEAEFIRQGGARAELLVPNYRTLARCVATTDRIGFMPRSLAREYARTYPISYWPAPLRLPLVKTTLLSFSAKSKDVGVSWLIDLIREEFIASDTALKAVAS